MEGKILLSHSGKQHSYQVARAMENLGVLDTFYTSSYVKQSWLQAYFLRSGNDYFTRRFISGVVGPKVNANWRFEVKEIVLRKLFGKIKKTQDAVYARDVQFDKYVAKQIKKRYENGTISEGSIFWGFQGSCYFSLIAAREAGMITVIELATAHVIAARRILGEEKELHSEWADSIDNLYFPADYEERLVREPHLADYVVAASEFTKSTLEEVGILPDKVIYLPLGVDTDSVEGKSESVLSKPIKLLYAGTVTQRKGIKYLLNALQDFDEKDIELHIYGHVQGSGEAFKTYSNKVKYHGAVSQKELFKLYKNFDFLVLPSVFEGFGLVIVEAMAAGVPVITTKHTFGAELIENKRNGFLVEIRSVEDLKEIFDYILKLNDDKYELLSKEAKKALSQVTWKNYEGCLKDKLLIINEGSAVVPVGNRKST
ncbi:glycosyltransferase family 4 protein [Mangrovimonas sp. DI 80]|uniref:glycosyltransferase family 4 protein n=1 Tax=Mangrovimonas sp. DI 80 TaxID=1779330 RepID=UPI0009766F02|nr:glycosyltransferase family 4 protein [Mangrovimonas sp. DI 80]OMP31777.1 hypothetical protein BKM32_01570 [Mangrovimonas sp. DI 80]